MKEAMLLSMGELKQEKRDLQERKASSALQVKETTAPGKYMHCDSKHEYRNQPL